MPNGVEGVTLPNEDATFDIYINSHLSEARRQKVLAHELRHIKKNHLYDARPVWLNEAEAG